MNEINNGKKKIIIAAIIVIFFAAVITVLIAVSNHSKNDDSNQNSNSQTTEEITYTATKPTLKKHQLSDDCTYILATGYDNENYYELVANQKDGFPQSTIEMGVIKNNEWLIPLSSDFPFLCDNWFNDKDAPYRDNDDPHDAYDSESYHFEYVGEGTFYYYYQEKYIAYQANQTIYKPDTGHWFKLYGFFIEERYDFLNNGEFLANDAEKGFCYYNLNTGEMRVMNGVFSGNNEPDRRALYGIHDGLFYARKTENYLDDKYEGFFDLNGNTVIDLSTYEITDYHEYKFNDGKYTITCLNNNKVEYDITFDTTGKIISEAKVG